MMAQYSIPFCVALSVYFDPTDPASFDARKLKDKKIAALMRKFISKSITRSKKKAGTVPRALPSTLPITGVSQNWSFILKARRTIP